MIELKRGNKLVKRANVLSRGNELLICGHYIHFLPRMSCAGLHSTNLRTAIFF